MGPAADMYCKVVNGILQARDLASQTIHATTSGIRNLFELAANMKHTGYTVATERAAIIFNKVVPPRVREAAKAYLKRVKAATDLSAEDSFLRSYSPQIAAVVSLAHNDVHEMCVRLYDPIQKKWESRANFDFGRSLVPLLANVPSLDFSEVYG